MENLWLVLFWSGPIGLGVFLALLGTFILLLAKANEISKRVKWEETKREGKGREEKRIAAYGRSTMLNCSAIA